MSKIAEDVFNCLVEIFPFNSVQKEHYVYYKNNRLFFDFYVKPLGILIECQGEQHFKFNTHFHGTVENFYGQKRRDNLKLQYIEENEVLTLVYFYDKVDKITGDLVLQRINEALDG